MQTMQLVGEPGSHLYPGVHASPGAHVPPPVMPPAPPVPVVAPAPPPSGLSQDTHVTVPFAPHMQSRQAPVASAPPQR
jgi:hypothetical protein